MATVYPTGLVSDFAAVTIEDPLLKLRYPDKDSAIANGFVFFGLPGQDPEIPSQQKKVYLVTEEGYSVAIDQPVKLSAGGVPIYDGSAALLAVDGSYSMKVYDHLYSEVDNSANPIYYFPHVEHRNLLGYSGVIPEEANAVAVDHTVTLSKLEATTCSFYLSASASTTTFTGRYLLKDVDYIVESPTKIKLTNTAYVGYTVLARALDPTGQSVPVGDVTNPIFIYNNKADAKTANLAIGDSVLINGGDSIGDGKGGSYLVVAAATGVDDNYTFINLDNGLQLKLKSLYQVFNSYYETIEQLSLTANDLLIDAAKSTIFKVTLTDNISTITVTNAPVSGEIKLQLEVKQNATAAKNITWLINGVVPKISGGTLPTMTQTLDAVDEYIIRTDDGGANWKLNIVGQDIK